MKGLVGCFFVLAVFQAASAMNVTEFFKLKNNNLTLVTWAHAVNSFSELNTTLNNDVKMIEADVVLGYPKGADNKTAPKVPIMAHPPNNVSDLTLEDFLGNVTAKNATKGVKLDFKSMEALNASLSILERLNNNATYPFFINADVLSGPVNSTTTPLDKKEFLDKAKKYPRAVLSLGWTTNFTSDNSSIKSGEYTKEQIDAMLNLVKDEKVNQPVTFAVRAGPASNNIEVVKKLTSQTEEAFKNATLTIWSHKDDVVNATNLSQLINDVGVTKVYLDVPEDLMKQLKLNGASGVSVTSFTMVASLLFGYLFSSLVRRG